MEEYQDLIEVIEKLNDDLEELEELLDVAKSSWSSVRLWFLNQLR